MEETNLNVEYNMKLGHKFACRRSLSRLRMTKKSRPHVTNICKGNAPITIKLKRFHTCEKNGSSFTCEKMVSHVETKSQGKTS
jgi:hypothetical protein